MPHLIPILLSAVVLLFSGCKTAKEAGEDAARDKLDFAQGAADVLKGQGGHLGKTVGQGATDLIKGVATGVKDSVHPPLEIRDMENLNAAGITVISAQQDGDGIDVRRIDVYLKFGRPFIGRLRLELFDEKGVEIGNTLSPFLDEPENKSSHVLFSFDAATRLSRAAWGRVSIAPPVALKLSDDLSQKGLKIVRIKETDTPFSVAPYLIFDKAFKGGLQLRAFDAAGLEMERSTPDLKLDLSADEAQVISFGFTSLQPLQAARYELHAISR